ncbi:hypothetical protein XOCgx_0550 [Xanthomonas oryzae pv. oryzicola]|nr:hypothetical protein XOCgx_0550 [Xanthomonas oryzae pv. oryzicola]
MARVAAPSGQCVTGVPAVGGLGADAAARRCGAAFALGTGRADLCRLEHVLDHAGVSVVRAELWLWHGGDRLVRPDRCGRCAGRQSLRALVRSRSWRPRELGRAGDVAAVVGRAGVCAALDRAADRRRAAAGYRGAGRAYRQSKRDLSAQSDCAPSHHLRLHHLLLHRWCGGLDPGHGSVCAGRLDGCGDRRRRACCSSAGLGGAERGAQAVEVRVAEESDGTLQPVWRLPGIAALGIALRMDTASPARPPRLPTTRR